MKGINLTINAFVLHAYVDIRPAQIRYKHKNRVHSWRNCKKKQNKYVHIAQYVLTPYPNLFTRYLWKIDLTKKKKIMKYIVKIWIQFELAKSIKDFHTDLYFVCNFPPHLVPLIFVIWKKKLLAGIYPINILFALNAICNFLLFFAIYTLQKMVYLPCFKAQFAGQLTNHAPLLRS